MTLTDAPYPSGLPVLPPELRPDRRFSDPVFHELCDGCGDCAAVCPEKIIIIGASGQAELAAAPGVCGGCGLCADACTRGALVERMCSDTTERLRSARIGGRVAQLVDGVRESGPFLSRLSEIAAKRERVRNGGGPH